MKILKEEITQVTDAKIRRKQLAQFNKYKYRLYENLNKFKYIQELTYELGQTLFDYQVFEEDYGYEYPQDSANSEHILSKGIKACYSIINSTGLKFEMKYRTYYREKFRLYMDFGPLMLDADEKYICINDIGGRKNVGGFSCINNLRMNLTSGEISTFGRVTDYEQGIKQLELVLSNIDTIIKFLESLNKYVSTNLAKP